MERKTAPTKEMLLAEIQRLNEEKDQLAKRLEESEQTLAAIQGGEVDAILVSTEGEERIYTLKGADDPYRVLFEQIDEGAMTISEDGLILYANQSFARLLQVPLEEVIGADLLSFVHLPDKAAFRRLLDESGGGPAHGDVSFVTKNGSRVPSRLSISILPSVEAPTYCLVAADLSEHIRAEDALRAAYDESEIMVQQRTAEVRKAMVDLEVKGVELASLLASTRVSKEREELLADVAGRLLASSDPQSVIDDLCQRTMRFLDCDVFFNYLLERESGRLHLNACAGIPRAEAKRIEWLDKGVAVCGCVAMEGRRIVVEDILNTADRRTDLVRSYGVQAYACHPLIMDGRTIGTLSFGSRSRPRFTSGELQVMKSVADNISIALSRLIISRALAESEEKYRQLFEYSLQNIGIYEVVRDESGEVVDWIILDANAPLQDFLGHSIEEIRGRRITELGGREKSEGSILRSNQVMKENRGHSYEVIWGGRCYDTSYFPLGETRLAVIGLDITERKLAEEALRESEERLRFHIENSPMAVVEWDRDLVVMRWAGEAEKMFGWSAAETVGRPIMGLDLIFPDDIHIVQETIAILTDGVTRQVTASNRNVTKDGRIINCTWFNSVRPGKDGHMASVLSLVVDNTARLKAERALRESEEKYRSIGELLPFGTWTTDAQGRSTYVSQSYCDLVGKSEDEILDAGWLDTLDPATVERTRADWSKTVSSGGYWENTHRIMGKDGKYHHILCRGIPITDEAGVIRSWAGVNIDITAQKKIEENLARSNAELEQFAYISSHDLQEPLRMVMASLARLEKKHGASLDVDAKRYLQFAVEGATRMRELINDLLAFSRIDSAGKEFVDLDMNRMLALALGNLDTAISSENATIFADHLPTITADETQMVQLFQNLISNAIKYHDKDPPVVHIRCQEEGASWVFSVQDNGIGIEAQYHEKIFHMFQRLHTRGVYEGTGIGLAISKKIVERHGGRIWVESELGKGATFFFSLPKQHSVSQ
jgi:PAS domain S-box-containing protein